MTEALPKVWVINGPNLNLLGRREPHIYGTQTLADIEQTIKTQGASLGLAVECFQSNHEGGLIDILHSAPGQSVRFIVINAGAYTHTSIALADALAGIAVPYIEVHLSNVYAREAFRHHSYLSQKAQAVLCGFGSAGYGYALDFIRKSL
jgi:3-dehydroquinate dehydratase-2